MTARAPDLEDGDLISLDEEAHAYPSHRPILAQGEGEAEASLRNVYYCVATAVHCGGVGGCMHT